MRTASVTFVLAGLALALACAPGRAAAAPASASAPAAVDQQRAPAPAARRPVADPKLDARVGDLLTGLDEPDADVRETVFDQLSDLWAGEAGLPQVSAGNPAIDDYRRVLRVFFARHPELADPTRLALIRLLAVETRTAKSGDLGAAGDDPESYANYVFSLTEAVSALKDDRAIPVLIAAISFGGVDLLQYGDKALAPLQQALASPDALDRATALKFSARLLEPKKDQPSRKRLDDLLRASMMDSAPVVRTAAVREAACLDSRRLLVPALQQIASSDPYSLGDPANPPADDAFYPVRTAAKQSLSEIRSGKPCSR